MQKWIITVGSLLVLGVGAAFLFDYFTTNTPVTDLPTLQSPITGTLNVEKEVTPPAKNDIETRDVKISSSDAYTISIPINWRTEKKIDLGSATYSSIFVYDENGALVMRIGAPIREVGYEGMSSQMGTLESGIGQLERVIRRAEENQNSGFAHYLWSGRGDFWGNSFEIMVYFRSSLYYPTAEDYKAGRGTPLRFGSFDEFQKEQTMLEKLIANIQIAR